MQRTTGDSVDIESWLERNAAAMAMFHGEAHLIQDEAAWAIHVDVGDGIAPLQAWGMVDYWVRWIAEQTQIVAKPRDFVPRPVWKAQPWHFTSSVSRTPMEGSGP